MYKRCLNWLTRRQGLWLVFDQDWEVVLGGLGAEVLDLVV